MRRRLCCNPAEQRSRAEMRAGVSACVRKEEDLLFLDARPVHAGETRRLEEQKDSARLLCRDEREP